MWRYLLILTLVSFSTSGAGKGNSASLPRLSKRWWTVGPFASGKVEYDGDPLIPLGGVRKLFELGPAVASKGKLKPSYLSEHADGGLVGWKSIDSTATGGSNVVHMPIDHIPFSKMMENPPLGGSSDILHVQYWVVGSLKVKDPGRYGISCRGLHTFQIALAGMNSSSIGPLAGNIYGDNLGVTPVDFTEEGVYRLFTRVRGKVPLQFSCSISTLPRAVLADVKTKNLPDVVLGKLVAGPSPVDLRVLNTDASWLDIKAEVKQPKNSKATKVEGASASIRLAPGAMAQLPVLVSVDAVATEKDAAACVQFELSVTGRLTDGTRVSDLTVAVQLRCRKSTQSALFSFIEKDGSVGIAAILRPNKPPAGVALPIVVSMSGVGVEPQGQADAYKMKPTPKHRGDYIFGFEDMWVLAPQRGGPHNWEDVGIRTALRAIEVLALTQETPKADPNRLVIHGHSRGGHGAWGLATRIPDRVLGVASACGWYSREEYGDANNIWIHETSLMHLDKTLLGLMQASVAENENSLHASNLRGMRALVRTATQDRAVPPWFSRRMARHMQEEGVNVSFEEFSKEHWWWDTKETNDGGVMHDPSIRSWTIDASTHGSPSLEDILKLGEFVLVASSPEYAGRFGLRILQRNSPASRAFIRINHHQSVSLRTANVRRFVISAGSSISILMNGVANVDGARVTFNANDGIELCRDMTLDAYQGAVCEAKSSLPQTMNCKSSQLSTTWQACSDATGAPPLSRSLDLLGPIRRVFATQWIVVVPDDPSALETRLATYFSNGHLIAVDTATQTLTASDATAFRRSHRFVWLGEASRLLPVAKSSWPIGVADGEESALSVGPCVFGKGHGAVFIAPAANIEHDPTTVPLLDLVVTATDPKALEDLVSFSFATNQPHTRAPMSNMLPDFLVSGPDFRWKGYGGIAAAGYFGADWRIAPNSAYFQC